MRTNRSMPDCTVIPELPCPDVNAAAAWLCDAFGFTVRLRIGDHRVQVNVGDGAVVLTRGDSGSRSVMVRVENADAHHARAVQHGAETSGPPADHPYGERQYSARDPAGHRWTFSQTIADVDPADWGGTMEQVPPD